MTNDCLNENKIRDDTLLLPQINIYLLMKNDNRYRRYRHFKREDRRIHYPNISRGNRRITIITLKTTDI